MSRDALEGEGPRRWPQEWLGRWLEEAAKAVGGGYCRLHMPLKLVLGITGTVAGHRLGALERGGLPPPPSKASLPMCLRPLALARGLWRWSAARRLCGEAGQVAAGSACAELR